MDYSEQLYQELLKMRILGKKNCDQEKVKQGMTDTMYEIMGYKEKGQCDKIFNEWTQRVFPQGYWAPGMN